MNKKYISSVRQLTARPRSKRLREQGGTIVGGGSVHVSVEGGASSATDPNSHKHTNLDVLERISTDDQDYICLNQYVEDEETDGFSVKKERAKVGFADMAGALAEEAMKKLMEMFLRKDKDDRSKGYIATDRGVEIGKFLQGELGSGGILKIDEDGNSYLEVDKALFRKIAYFVEIMIKKLSHVGGSIILSPASMKCSQVEEYETYYRCYFENKHEGQEIFQEFEVGDQARSQTFKAGEGVSQNVSSQYYWRLVVNVGDNFIDLSKEDCDSGSGVPLMGDEIVLCGNRSNPDRQGALILSSYGEGTPSLIMYKNICSYSLADAKTTTKLSPKENKLTGIVNIEEGSTGASNLEDFPDEVFKAVHIGAVNLLLNSGFTGDYKAEELDASYALKSDSELFSKKLKHWTGTASVSEEPASASGKSATIGSLSQTVEVMAGESYVVSFMAKGTSLSVALGNSKETLSLKAEYDKYSVKIVSDGVCTFSISGDASIFNLQLERGTIGTDWHPSPYDNDKTLAEFQALKYIKDAIVEGDTTILGGLILSSLIMLGNYKDGKMEKVNAGVSGIYNDDDDVAFWGGGTFEQAIATIMKFKQNPNYRPTDAEWKNLAKFAMSHGGDLFLKGTIFADNGYFRGDVYARSGIFKNVKSPNGAFDINDKGDIKIDGEVYAKSGRIGGFDINTEYLSSGEVASGVMNLSKRVVGFKQTNGVHALIGPDAFPLVSGVEGAMYAEAPKGGYSYFGHGAARLAARKGYESILVGGLALNCNTGTDFIKKYDNQDFWADFIVADGDVTLPEGLDCEGKVLHVRIKGTHKVKSAGNYSIFKSKSSSSVSEVEYEDASVTFICCGSAWYEF